MTLEISVILKAASDERDRLGTGRWAIAYRGAEPRDPLLVQTTPPARPYYIVQFQQADRTTGLLLINAESGKINAIAGVQSPTESMFRFLRPSEVSSTCEEYGRRLLSGQLDPSVGADRRLDPPVAISAANVTVEPALFWEPCDQSLTPFQPFYRAVHTRSDGRDALLVRVDGEVFTKITHGGAGM